jgi:hypothetical protein
MTDALRRRVAAAIERISLNGDETPEGLADAALSAIAFDEARRIVEAVVAEGQLALGLDLPDDTPLSGIGKSDPAALHVKHIKAAEALLRRWNGEGADG